METKLQVSITIIAKILIMFMTDGKVEPHDYDNLFKIANGRLDEVK